jgi:hypothetical protein
MSEVHCREAPTPDLESEWCQLRETGLMVERDYRIAAQRLRAEANLFEIAKKRFEIAQIMETRFRIIIESRGEQQGAVVALAK